MLDATLARALPALTAQLGAPEGEPVKVEGGITNCNVRMRFAGRDCMVRLCDDGAGVLGIDRATEALACERAAALGVGPDVLARLEDPPVLVTAWVEGGPLAAGALRGAILERVARSLRAVHDGPALPTAFDVFGLVEAQRAALAAPPAGLDALIAAGRRIAAALGGHPEHAPVPCHNDLLAANLLAGGRWIVDWEYAGMNDRFFDLGNLAVNNALDADGETTLLAAYFGEPPTARRRAALALMRVVSDLREALWGLVQEQRGTLDVDYGAYAAMHLDRLRAAAGDPRLERWMDDAAAA